MGKFRYNRAVDAANKGDVFESDPSHWYVQSLLGAGYVDPVYEPDDAGYEPAVVWMADEPEQEDSD